MYGSVSKLAKDLRLFKKGKLLNQIIKNEEYCPQDPSKIFKNGNQTKMTISFLAGNQNSIKLLTFIVILYRLMRIMNI